MIGKKMQDAMNDQINAETFSAYLYWSMAAYFESENLPGFAGWMRVQAQEEMVHAAKLAGFIHERGGRVLLKAIKAPATEWDSALAAFEAAYKHEQLVSGRINGLVDLAASQKDHASAAFLQWFVTEQVEEEASADAIVQKLKRVQKAPGGLYMLDREMGARTFRPPAASEED